MIECLAVLTGMIALLVGAITRRNLVAAKAIARKNEAIAIEKVSRPNQYKDWDMQFREANNQAAHVASEDRDEPWQKWGCDCAPCSTRIEQHAKQERTRVDRVRIALWLSEHNDCKVESSTYPVRNWAGDTMALNGVIRCFDHGDVLELSTRDLQWIDMLESKSKHIDELSFCDMRICKHPRGHEGDCAL